MWGRPEGPSGVRERPAGALAEAAWALSLVLAAARAPLLWALLASSCWVTTCAHEGRGDCAQARGRGRGLCGQPGRRRAQRPQVSTVGLPQSPTRAGRARPALGLLDGRQGPGWAGGAGWSPDPWASRALGGQADVLEREACAWPAPEAWSSSCCHRPLVDGQASGPRPHPPGPGPLGLFLCEVPHEQAVACRCRNLAM